MRINYFSDIHLEFGEIGAPSADADLIIAAGDIGLCDQGVDWLKSFGRPVVYVAGNHEFYTNEYREVMVLIRSQCIDSNVHFLENRAVIINGVRILGCTLWTDLFSGTPEQTEALRESLNDFKKIRLDGKDLDPEMFSTMHRQSKLWLENELAKPFAGKTVIVSHHAPTEWSWNEASNAPKKLAYCNDLKSIMYNNEVAAWFHGHTHYLADYRIAGTRVLCNPRGYSGVRTVNGFDINRVVEI